MSLSGPHRESLPEALVGIVGMIVMGGLLTGVVLLTIGLPLYLVARWIKQARPLLAILTGAVIGALIFYVLSEVLLPAVALGCLLGAVNGYLFLRIAGESPRAAPRQA
jgi:hypothetical protein